MKTSRSNRRDRRQQIISPSDSILYTEWVEPNRPYSQLELTEMEERLFRNLQLSTMHTFHEECGHSYFVKNGGLKYKQLLEQGDGADLGNCSVCWKLHNTPYNLNTLCVDFVNLHSKVIEEHQTVDRKSLFNYQIFKIFYTWLYNEFFEK